MQAALAFCASVSRDLLAGEVSQGAGRVQVHQVDWSWLGLASSSTRTRRIEQVSSDELIEGGFLKRTDQVQLMFVTRACAFACS